jgi:cytoskeletal protein CcmA (bactofilin family)
LPAAAQESRAGGLVFAGNSSGSEAITGGTVIVDEPVEGNLTVFAGNVYIQEDVEGSVTVFAGNTHLYSDVEGNFTAFSGNVIIKEEASVDGLTKINSGTTLLSGELESAKIAGGSMLIQETGVVRGDLNLSVGEFENLGTVEGEINEIQTGNQVSDALESFLTGAFSFAGRLVVGAALLFLLPGVMRNASERIRESYLRDVGFGILTLVAVPAAAVLLLITIAGIPLGLILLTVYVLAVWLSGVVGSYSVGRLLTDNRWVALVAGTALWVVVGSLPVLGSLARLSVTLVALGGIAIYLYSGFRS